MVDDRRVSRLVRAAEPRIPVPLSSDRAPLPRELRTSRLLLRPWRPADAIALSPILDENWEHLGPWIPSRVALPAPVDELEQRLAGFGNAFADDREWRFAMLSTDERTLYGELDLFPRSDQRRVPYTECDRAELGYWIRKDGTGRGLVTEAAAAMVETAWSLPRIEQLEIRCDERNAPSTAVPRRLGFVLDETIDSQGVAPGESIRLQIWRARRPG